MLSNHQYNTSCLWDLYIQQNFFLFYSYTSNILNDILGILGNNIQNVEVDKHFYFYQNGNFPPFFGLI